MSFEKRYLEIAERIIIKIRQANLINVFPKTFEAYNTYFESENKNEELAFQILKELDLEQVYRNLSYYLVSSPYSIEELEDNYRALTDLEHINDLNYIVEFPEMAEGNEKLLTKKKEDLLRLKEIIKDRVKEAKPSELNFIDLIQHDKAEEVCDYLKENYEKGQKLAIMFHCLKMTNIFNQTFASREAIYKAWEELSGYRINRSGVNKYLDSSFEYIEIMKYNDLINNHLIQLKVFLKSIG